MQSTYLPRHICDAIDKKCRSFVWGEVDGSKWMHMVNWRRICSTKLWGGLGLRMTRDMNQAAMMKAGWNLISNRDEIRAEVIRTKYRCGRSLIPNIDPTKPGSNFWQGLCHSWKRVESKIIWRVGSGTQINVWKDRWLPGGSILKDLTLRPLEGPDWDLRLCDITNSTGWCLDHIAHIIPDEVKCAI